MRDWDPAEDVRIRALVATRGSKWSKMVAAFDGRSVSSIRNRWQRMNTRLRKKNRCCRCGLAKRGHTCTATATSDSHEEPADEATATTAKTAGAPADDSCASRAALEREQQSLRLTHMQDLGFEELCFLEDVALAF